MIKKYSLQLTVVVLTSCTTFLAFGQSSNMPPFVADSLDSYINKAIQEWNIPGLSIAIVKDDKVILQKGFGYADIEKTNKVDENTIFMIASNVKSFTGTSLALLEHDSMCSLNDKVTSWLPKFNLYNTHTTNQATLRDLLTHNLGYSTFQGDWLCFYSDLTIDQMYEYYSLIEPVALYREKYGYSNMGYTFAGECIEKISGMPWREYMHKKILTPLEMNRTFLTTNALYETSNIAYGHTLEQNKLKKFPHPNPDAIGAAAGMASTAHDLANWVLMQVNNGVYNDDVVLPAKVVAKVRHPFTIVGKNGHLYNKTNYHLYGLGWVLEDYQGSEIVSHSGGIWGFVSEVAYLPKEKIGVVILANSDEQWFYEALKWEVIDAFLGLPYRNYSNEYLKRYNYRKETKMQNEEKLSQSIVKEYPFNLKPTNYIGTWSNPIYGKMEIRQTKEGLEATFEHHPEMKGLLQPVKDNSFLCTYTPYRWGVFVLQVHKSETGRLSIDVRVADRLDRETYRFEKIIPF